MTINLKEKESIACLKKVACPFLPFVPFFLCFVKKVACPLFPSDCKLSCDAEDGENKSSS